MSSSGITFKDIKIIDAVCVVMAVVLTAVRLVLRLHARRIWWDDALAFLSSLCCILTSTATGMHYGGPFAYTLVTRLAAYYLIAEGFYLTLWTARLAILFSIIRIIPDKAQERFLYHTAVAFAIVLVILLVQVFWVCEDLDHKKWKNGANPQCALGLEVAVCQLVTDIMADLLLIFVPVRLLTRTTLERSLKIRLAIIFSATILTTIVGLVHAAYLLEVRGVDAIISAVVEIAVCLVVCNLVVVVPAVYRACSGHPDDNSGSRRSERSFKLSSFRFRAGRSGAERTTVGGTGTMGLEPGVQTGEGVMSVGQGVSEETTGQDIEMKSDNAEVRAREADRVDGRVRWIQED